MLLFIVLPWSFCSSSFKSSRLVATAGLRGSGGTDGGRTVEPGVVTIAAAAAAGGAGVPGTGADVVVVGGTQCLGDGGVNDGTCSGTGATACSAVGCCSKPDQQFANLVLKKKKKMLANNVCYRSWR